MRPPPIGNQRELTFGILRVTRFFVALLMVLVALQYLRLAFAPLAAIETIEARWPTIITITGGFAVMIGLRALANALHRRWYGAPHPDLARTWTF